MTVPLRPARHAVDRHYVLVTPTHFAVEHAINPWMDPAVDVDRHRALRQWQGLVATYRALGHSVTELPGVAGLPDMVFAANGALAIDGRAVVASFAHPQRRPESAHFRRLLQSHLGLATVEAIDVNEAEGDMVVVGDVILAGTGFRTAVPAHHQVATEFTREVVTLELHDPRFYHLDVAVAALDDHTIAWYPAALAPEARRALARRFPTAIELDEHDAMVLGANLVSDGRHVVLDERATALAAAVEEAGFVAVPVAVDEFNKSGGGVKCLTMEVHRSRRATDRGTPGASVAWHANGSTATPTPTESRGAVA